MTIASGSRLGPYQILAPIGAGAMGEVYRARDTRLGRTVAIKVLPAELSRDADRIGRFRREARAASALNHPNIVQVYDVGEHDGIDYIAMEYVDGQTLRAMIEEGPLPVEKLIDYAKQLAAGLGKAHEAGVVHRDLKPENVIINDDGYVKIVDFGLAKQNEPLMETGSEAATLGRVGTTPGTILGTVAYMSPEQAKGEPADMRSDQFSLGSVLFEMATGRRAFHRDSAVQTLAAIIETKPSLAGDEARLPAGFASIVTRCHAKNPKERYASTLDLARELAALRPLVRPTSTARKRLPTHTVGRDELLTSLRSELSAAVDGQSKLLCLSGEAGIGKTTLVEAFIHSLEADGSKVTIARGRCSERLAGTEAYLPVLEALEGLSVIEVTTSELLREIAPSWSRLVTPMSSESEEMGSQERLKRELASFLETLTKQEPIVLVLEDLHWADVSTVDLLTYLAAHFDAMRLLVVATYRGEELKLSKHPFLSARLDLQTRGLCREIELPFLGADDIARYLDLEFQPHDFPRELPALIHAKTEGSPLFMADLIRYLRNQGVIAQAEETWILARPLPDVEESLPQSVRSMIQKKLDQLDEAERRLMLLASTQGHEFQSFLLAEILDIDPVDVEDRLESLEAVHALVRFVGEEELPDRTPTLRYRFVHVLYQNALYGALRPTRKRTWSLAAAGALERRYADRSVDIASGLAYLFYEGHDFERAADHYRHAAERAAKVSAHDEAIALARRGLEAATALPESAGRARGELGLLMTLGAELMVLRGYSDPEAGELYIRARELCRTLGESAAVLPVVWGLVAFHVVRGNIRTALSLGEELMELSVSLGHSTGLIYAHWARSMHLQLGEPTEAWKHLERCIELYDPDEHQRAWELYRDDVGVGAYVIGSWAQWILGFPDKARHWASQARELARELSRPFSVSYGIVFSALTHQLLREPEQTYALTEEARAISLEHGFSLWLAWADVWGGWALARQGKVDEGIARIERGESEQHRIGARQLACWRACLLAEAYMLANEPARGIARLTTAIEETEAREERMYVAEARRLLGELHLALGDEPAAEENVRSALTIAQQQGAKSLELRAATSLGRLLQSRGESEAARDAVASSYRWFTEGFDTPDLKDAASLLDSLPS